MAQMNLKRRSVLRATALGAGAAMLGQEQAQASPAGKKLAGKKAIVIGSGFGGAVAAYRLGQAGVKTTVLEKGMRGAGVIAKHVGDGITVLSGAGVGGTSLVSTVSMDQPRRTEWEQVYSAELPYDVMDKTYWPRARRNLSATLDRAYLMWAEATANVTVKALHEVTEIREVSNGFEVRCQKLNQSGDVLSTNTLACDFLFMAAGAVNTSSLLVTARAKGWLPRLRETVGKGFGNNGDFLVTKLNSREARGSTKIYDDANPHVSAASMAFDPVPGPAWAGRTTTHLITSMAPERGEIRYDAATGAGKVYWPYGVMETQGEKAGADLVTRLWWEKEGKQGRLLSGLPNYDRSFGHGMGAKNTWSPLGGMAMGQNTDFGGKSLDYNNLYCIDGSLLPGTACLANPSLTITANAERCMDRFIAEHA